MFNRVQRQVQRLALSPESSKSSLTMSPILSSSSSFQLVMERVERNPLTLTDEDIDQAHQLQGRMRVFSTSSHASTRSAASEEDDDEFGFVPDRILNPDTADSDELIKKRTTPMFQRVQRKPVLLNVDAALFEGQEVLLDGTTTNTSNFSSPPLSPVRMFAKVTRNQVMLRLNLLDDESESGTDDEKLLGGGDGGDGGDSPHRQTNTATAAKAPPSSSTPYKVLFDRVRRKPTTLQPADVSALLYESGQRNLIGGSSSSSSTRHSGGRSGSSGGSDQAQMNDVGRIWPGGTPGLPPGRTMAETCMDSAAMNIPPSMRRSTSTDHLSTAQLNNNTGNVSISSETTTSGKEARRAQLKRISATGGGFLANPPASTDLEIPKGYMVASVLLKHQFVTVALLRSVTDPTFTIVLKQIYLSRTTDLRVRHAALSERRAHEKVGHHPFICTCLAAYATDDGDLCLLLRYCRGGNLLQRIRKLGGFSVSASRILFAQVVSALSHCHQKGVAHRDLKPENIMLTEGSRQQQQQQQQQRQRQEEEKGKGKQEQEQKQAVRGGHSLGRGRTLPGRLPGRLAVGGNGGHADNMHAMLSDFGLAQRKCYWNSGAKDLCGTPQYASPEVASGKEHGLAVDCWSLGILLWEMLVGYTPFQTTSMSSLKIIQILRSIENHMHIFKLPKHIRASKSLVDLIQHLLEPDPVKRWTVHDVMRCDFLHGISWSELMEGRTGKFTFN